MTILAYSFRTAARNLRRGGQRALVALLCIVFGVMSVVSMSLLSEALHSMLVVEPEHLVGADLTMDRTVEDAIFPDHIAGLQALQEAGKIDRFTLVAYSASITFRKSGSGELKFPAAGMGIEPDVYPLAGSFTLADKSASVASLIQQPGDVLVTSDIAKTDDLQVGDVIFLSDLGVGAVVEGRVRGIVTDTPNHQGSKIYYSLETARQLAGGAAPENTALAMAGDPEAVLADLQSLGWRAFSAAHMAQSNESVYEMFDLAFKGAGILGMLVGGIGIANTMQVLLRRRQREVAVYKTLGYRKGQLQTMFAAEAALLGAIGSLLGAALGIIVSIGLVELFSRITTLLIRWVFSPVPVINGILVGVVTTISFAAFAIVAVSQVPPLALLRREALTAGRIPWLQSAAVALFCAVPFTAVTIWVMGSVLKGLGVLIVAVIGLVSLGGFLGGLAWLLTRLLTLRAWPLLRMARNNLRRRGASLVFAMIALFVGVVSLAFGVVVTSSAGKELDAAVIQILEDNILIIAPAAEETAVRQTVEQLMSEGQVDSFSYGYQTAVRTIRMAGSPDVTLSPVLVGREDPGNYWVSGAPWGSDPNGVYTYQAAEIPAGSEVEVTLLDGSVHVLPVIGTYTIDYQGTSPYPAQGLLMSNELILSLVQPESVRFAITAPAGKVQAASAAFGAALPQVTVINVPAYAARFTQSYVNLFVFAAAMAGLALLAGALLIANSVSLAMLDRRYEIGVLKAMGYARRQVQLVLVVEYILVALIATAAGLLAVQVILWLIGLLNPLAGSLLVIAPEAAAVILLASVGLILLTVLAVTWRPVKVSPVVVLNDRE